MYLLGTQDIPAYPDSSTSAQAMAIVKKYGLQLIEYINQEGVKQGVNPFDYGAAYTDIMKTQALKQALNKYGFTAAFGGGRRDSDHPLAALLAGPGE